MCILYIVLVKLEEAGSYKSYTIVLGFFAETSHCYKFI